MSFLDFNASISDREISRTIDSADPAGIRAALSRGKIDFPDFLGLLSPAAAEILEEIALAARRATLKHFGRAVTLYAPLYLSNECDNNCVYCGFSRTIREKRVTLPERDAEAEADFLFRRGFRHLLLVSGEKRDRVTLPYLERVISAVHASFASTGLEIFPLEENGYRRLAGAGADSLTIYQEVYDREIYRSVHRGSKADYEYRISTPERAASAGFHTLNIGALLGLAPWPLEAARLGLHAAWLKKTFWRTRIAVSFPRLTPSRAGFTPLHPVSDRQLAQMICALRLLLPTADLVISTRERAGFREKLLPLGITRMSAGSKTEPGGYQSGRGAESQFSVHDGRSLEEVSAALSALGYDPVRKDWDRSLSGR